MAVTDTQNPSLYDRLGGKPGVQKNVNYALDRNFNNPLIGHHFRHEDMDKLKQLVFEFFSMGFGGPHTYTGRDMRTVHKSLDISENNFLEANKDTLLAWRKTEWGRQKKME